MPVILKADYYEEGEIDVILVRSREHRVCNSIWFWLPRGIRRRWRNRLGKSYEKGIKRQKVISNATRVRVFLSPNERVLI